MFLQMYTYDMCTACSYVTKRKLFVVINLQIIFFYFRINILTFHSLKWDRKMTILFLYIPINISYNSCFDFTS